MKQFDISKEVTDLVTTTFLLGYVVGVCSTVNSSHSYKPLKTISSRIAALLGTR